VSHEHTFDEDTSDPEVLERTLLAMAEGVSGRLRHSGLKAATVAVKIRDSGFNTITRQRTLAEPTDMTEPIWRTAVELARPEIRGKRIRLLGVATSGFGEREQLGLFGVGDDRRRRVVEAADEVRERFGTRAITRARLLKTGVPAPFERDLGTAVERRGEHAEDRERDARKRRSGSDSQADTTPVEDVFDD
jgi:DNA polymerase-4